MSADIRMSSQVIWGRIYIKKENGSLGGRDNTSFFQYLDRFTC